MKRVLLRGQPWIVRDQISLGVRTRFRLEDPETGETVETLCPPDEFEPLVEPATALDRRSLTPFGIWRSLHEALRLQSPGEGRYAAFNAGRISPEPYQFAPLSRLLSGPRRSLLIADDVGLGKTIEAGICLVELIARGVGKRILLVVPPGLIPQWLDEMWEKFGLEFQPIENAASLDRAQTALSEGLQPWAYFDRVITSTEYLKRRDVHAAALSHPWDAIVVDEAHYLAESGTPANPYSTARTRLGPKLRDASRALILLTATPHNGYKHSFRSLLELVEPADAALHGRKEDIQRRVARSMIRRLKPQIVKSAADGSTEPAFPVRLPVQRIEVRGLSDEEREIFTLVSVYCSKTVQAAAGSEEADLVSFAMQIVKKRMLSSRAALHQTVKNRLEALASRKPEEPPARAELRELQGDLPLAEAAAERTATRILRAAIARDAKRREAEKRQLKTIEKLLDLVASRPDPKIAALVADLERDVCSISGEKAIVFTEYRDTLAALRNGFVTHPALRDAFVELTGGLSASQRKSRIARFHEPSCQILLATDAASEGLNLQMQCRRLYHFELPWNPNRLEQRNGRIDRHGQTRPPIIRYLFYADSPEDRVLDRLVQRITQMHDDRVSTPDILGIVEGSRIEDVLGRIDSPQAGEAESQTLMKLFEARQQEFIYEIAPLLWHRQVVRLHKEFQYFARIVPTRESEQKRKARLRAYGELTTDRERAFALTYLAETGLLPSYQFPTDTFSLDPGVGDTPTLRRPAWIALFEFAPGNMVYANGHKLKSIRAFFEGGPRSGSGERGADQSGRVEPFCFCDHCGFATRETVNTCPSCSSEMRSQADVALIDSFEAEENTQITSAEDSRQRLNFQRREHLLDDYEGEINVYPYEFVALEFRPKASLLVTNWGRQARWGGQGDRFELCPDCGRHRPHGLAERAMQRWDDDHHRICNGNPRPYILGYSFSADVLVFPVPPQLAPSDEDEAKAFCRTLGKALVVGAQEVLEIEADEIAYFAHKDGAGGWTLVFYETAPGGAGYLEQLAGDLSRWARAGHERLYGHECDRACYRCLKSARNQFDHALLDKELVRDVLFQLSAAQRAGESKKGRTGDGRQLSMQWLERETVTPTPVPTSGTPIEKRLLEAIVESGRLPIPAEQHEIRSSSGELLTIPDFAYLDRKVAIYCDGFAYHGNVDTLSSDARKRNTVQSMGWAVLTFWGRQILRDPTACERQIWQCYEYRRPTAAKAA